MKKGYLIKTTILTLLLLVLCAAEVYGDHARVGTSGLWRFRIYNVYGWASQAFDSAGHYDDIISIAVRNWNEDIDFIYPLGKKLGYLKNNAKLSFARTDFLIDYGLTDSIFLEVWVPVYQYKKLSLGTWTYIDDESNDTVSEWLDEAYGDAAIWKAKQIYPSDLDARGVGDILVGWKHQLYKSDRARFAYATGLRLPTGRVDDPDDLDDTSLGDGQMDLGLWFYYDYITSPHFFLNIHTRFEYQMKGTYDKPSDPAVLRMLEDDDPGGTYDMTPGWFGYLEIEPQWSYNYGRVAPSFLLIAMYKAKDNYEGWTQGGGDSYKEMNTDYALVTLSPKFYLYRIIDPDGGWEKIPFELSLEYRFPLFGKNYPATSMLLFEAKLYAKFW